MGNAYTVPYGSYGYPVHPHVHGERHPPLKSGRSALGSSPRTWGTQKSVVLAKERDRFIPTYMGNASRRSRCRPSTTVHPHVHGERSGTTGIDGSVVGSSPRTWGTRIRALSGGIPGRFIPTYMGNAYCEWLYTERKPVHPHVHGERLPAAVVREISAGSSPRTWGTRNTKAGWYPHVRFIPTYMGNADT